MSRGTHRVSVVGCALAVLGAAACADVPTESPAGADGAPQFATVLTKRRPYTPPQDANGVYLLPKACDVLIGEPIVLPGDPVPTMYEHQLLVDVPPGSTVRLVPDPSARLPRGVSPDTMLDETFTPAADGTVFGCDARDPDDPTKTVIDPATLHPAKGNGIEINTDGITLDLNGYGIHSWVPVESFDSLQTNIGVAVIGSGITVTNTRVNGSDGKPVISRVTGFGHTVDMEAHNPTLRGLIVDHDGDPSTPDEYNLFTQGFVTVRRFTGHAEVDAVKSVNLDPIQGEGMLLRECGTATVTVKNSHFVGGATGVFIRECLGFTFEDNFVSSPGGHGIETREAFSAAGDPAVIRDNTIANTALSGIHWGRDSRNLGDLTIVGNDISGWGVCGFELSNDNASISPLTLADIEAANTFPAGAANKTCLEQ